MRRLAMDIPLNKRKEAEELLDIILKDLEVNPLQEGGARHGFRPVQGTQQFRWAVSPHFIHVEYGPAMGSENSVR